MKEITYRTYDTNINYYIKCNNLYNKRRGEQR